MKYGVCMGVDQPERIRIAAECGFDYIETSFTALTQAENETYRAFCRSLAENRIACEAANCFLPGNIHLTGDAPDLDAVRTHVEKGMQRAGELGIRVVVFGSGGARSLPEGFSFRKGFVQLTAFLREIAGPAAAKYGISIAIEPLCPRESNIINRVKEGVMLAAASGCDNVGGLGDLYHMAIIGEGGDELRALQGSLLHTHIANPALKTDNPRRYPLSPSEYDYGDFLHAAEYAGCPRCSIEAGCNAFESDAPRALAVLRSV